MLIITMFTQAGLARALISLNPRPGSVATLNLASESEFEITIEVTEVATSDSSIDAKASAQARA